MPVAEFDVYLIGARDPEPSGQLRVAAAIAGRHHLPAPEVAAALMGTPLRVAARLSAADAQALVDALAALGGTARVSPTGVPLAAGTTSIAPRAGRLTDPVSGVHMPDRRITLKSADAHAVPAVVDVAEPIDFAEPGADARTGVRGPDIVRCPVHGLAYNRRQTSGCVRCLAPARARARTLEDAGVAESRAGGEPPSETEAEDARTGAGRWLRARFATPARRALFGLLVALVLGFLPAAYHARASTRGKAVELRRQQAEVAAAPITVETLARFDALDAQVDAIHLRGAKETLLIWLVVTGAAGFAWSRLT